MLYFLIVKNICFKTVFKITFYILLLLMLLERNFNYLIVLYLKIFDKD